MDQNNQFDFYQSEQPYAQVPQEKNARYFRGRAKAALKGNWLMTSVASFVYTLMQGLGVMAGIIPMVILVMGASLMTYLTGNDFGDSLSSGMVVSILIGYLLMFVVVTLICAPLTVGYYRVHLDLIDGKPVEVGSIFAYFKKGYWKTVGIFALLILIVLACSLLLCAFMIVGGVVGAMLDSEALFGVITVIGCIAFTALLMVVTYRYSMAPFILAEYPDMRAIDVMRNSSMLMRGRKWKLFCMQFSFLGWGLVYCLATLVTCGVAGMVGQYVLTAYMQTALAAFYDDAANRAAAREAEFPSLDPSDYTV